MKSVGSAVKKRRRSKLKTGAGARDERVKTEWVVPVRWLKQFVAVFPRSPCLDINSGVLQLLLNGRFATPLLGIGRILVLFVGHTPLGRYVLRPAQAHVIVRFRA